MKKTLITLAIMLIATMAQAQFKMHSNGRITFQTTVNTTAQGISFGPGPDWNVDFNGSVYMKKCAYFMNPTTISHGWMNACKTSNSTAACWLIAYPNWSNVTYFVEANGTVYSVQSRIISRLDDDGAKSTDTERINGDEALDILSQLNGYYVAPLEQDTPELENNEFVSPEAVEAMYADLTKRTAELSAVELSRFFPDAVRTNAQNRLCIDYQSIVTMLVEAVKEQQHTIETMRQVLEDNGLMAPKKP